MMADEDAIPKTIDKVIDIAESLGGHIAGRKDQSVQIKVPSASFREAMSKIDAIGGVVGRSVTADDVSEEFHDLEVRLGNLRATRTRLQDFLGKANGIQDMLTVERELERVAQEIDRIEGRLEFLRTRASMSVISVALTAKPKVVPIVVAPPPPPPPPARTGIDLPIPWVSQVGIDPLLSLRK
ncbi:MAG: Translation initiation factor 2 [Labilithrix sp.]|nr:Translation initiation factor 2 [Labilithrix sp.]